MAILLVMAHHLSIVRSDQPFDTAMLAFLHTGWIGVDLFFVLSGFLITGILLDSRDSDRYFTSFYTRRVLRIFPLYYLTIFISYHVLPHFPIWFGRLVGQGPFPPEQYFWLFLSNFVFAEQDQFQHGVLTVSWTLAIEEQFYLVWAAVVWLCPTRWLGPLCAFIVMGVPLLRALAVMSGASLIQIHVQTPYRADALAAGAWLAWRSRQALPVTVFRYGPHAVLAGLAGYAALGWWDGDLLLESVPKQIVGYSFLALTASGLIASAISKPADSQWVRTFSSKWLRMFGRYSYCLYLIHLPVLWTMKDLVFDPNRAFRLFGSAMPAQAVFWLVAAVPAVALAALSWRCFEEPILRLKRYFPY
jgi:peptidoglycan/LPS O-acetylase OafA/YrhL